MEPRMTDTSTLNGMEVKAFDTLIAEARERYLNTISDVLDDEVKRFILMQDRAALLEDAALFVCFMLALKVAEVRTPAGAVIDAKDPLRAWWPLEKRIKAEVAPMLLEYGKEAAAARVKGAAEEAAS
jgi:hypothetical protein